MLNLFQHPARHGPTAVMLNLFQHLWVARLPHEILRQAQDGGGTRP